ncbi:hypothetical protein [Flavobacterium sp. 102]|nr:hypothetical protein [Flavobacterium sp. 102]RKS03318.1 hypothetical protein C8C84_3066 [Flavobacterium sp. 102]
MNLIIRIANLTIGITNLTHRIAILTVGLTHLTYHTANVVDCFAFHE